jgi:RNA recognition motif-containing protein
LNLLGRGGSGSGSGGGGGYGFRRQNDGDVEILKDAIFIQNLPKNVTREELLDAFSTVGQIKVNELFVIFILKFFFS